MISKAIAAVVAFLLKLVIGSFMAIAQDARRKKLNKKVQHAIELAGKSDAAWEKVQEVKKEVDAAVVEATEKLKAIEVEKEELTVASAKVKDGYQELVEKGKEFDSVYAKHQERRYGPS